MPEMKRIRFNGFLDISVDNFEVEFESEVGYLLVHALEHGDAGGSFFTYTDDEITVEDFFEEEDE